MSRKPRPGGDDGVRAFPGRFARPLDGYASASGRARGDLPAE